jgi:hypothetical protein
MPDSIAAASTLAQEGRRISDEGASRGLNLRLSGGVAYFIHASDPALLEQLGRDPIRDLDFVGRADQRTAYKQLFQDLGYEINEDMLLAGEGRRFLFEKAGIDVDLFIDRLVMCHTIELRDRLTVRPLTLPLIDLLLQKLQIIDLTRKDMIDVISLAAGHDLGSGEDDIDVGYAEGLLGNDWGFYHTSMLNLDRISTYVASAPLEPGVREAVEDRLGRFADAIEAAPKSRKWKMRARVGTRKKWYEDVEEDIAAF